MSSMDANTDLILFFNNASNSLNYYLSIFIIIFGIIGNILNILVLSQRSLRSNSSAIYFLASAIVGIIVIISGLISRMLSACNLDLTLTIDWICKVRNFILYNSRTIFLWMIVLATIDRWLSSSISINLRSMSNLKNVQRSIIIILIYSCLINIPILYCYKANLSDILRACYGSTYSCRLTTDLIYAFGTVLLPLLLMIIFGLLTIKNVRHLQSRVHAINGVMISLENRTLSSNKSGHLPAKKTDRQLLKMLLVQVTLLFLFTSPHAIQKVYSSFASSPPSGSLDNAVQNFIFTILTLIALAASGTPFYIYTLTGGSVFRNALRHLVKVVIQKCYYVPINRLNRMRETK
ncbi:unnamed protein product [Adineta steineri]|uniref:G-protein coupled receptors family 1 profile domain-containing protein n=1 Tax=Adineta steineri TaxID=433720 RepID=A0A813RKV8_9BILA|nr:unnamed protein product [Adineta steineri]CAF1263818.1 unnamed protein product [Adineta steineri]CAF3686869.1 unnamed protein product [Adineta steineri]CAF3856548.1 unnamed protein product [Adineta steineri]